MFAFQLVLFQDFWRIPFEGGSWTISVLFIFVGTVENNGIFVLFQEKFGVNL